MAGPRRCHRRRRARTARTRAGWVRPPAWPRPTDGRCTCQPPRCLGEAKVAPPRRRRRLPVAAAATTRPRPAPHRRCHQTVAARPAALLPRRARTVGRRVGAVARHPPPGTPARPSGASAIGAPKKAGCGRRRPERVDAGAVRAASSRPWRRFPSWPVVFSVFAAWRWRRRRRPPPLCSSWLRRPMGRPSTVVASCRSTQSPSALAARGWWPPRPPRRHCGPSRAAMTAPPPPPPGCGGRWDARQQWWHPAAAPNLPRPWRRGDGGRRGRLDAIVGRRGQR